MTNLMERRVAAYELMEKAMGGDYRAKAELAESLTTSDFPTLYGQAVNSKLQAAYQVQSPVWKQYSTRVTVGNFQPQKLVSLLGDRRGLARVPEATEYPARDLSEGITSFKVEKYGHRIPLTWEMVVNDQLGAFRNLDQILADDAAYTESAVTVSALLAPDKNGVNTEFFKRQNGNAPESTELSAKALQEAIAALSAKKDAGGAPLVRPALVLVVPPALEVKARQILSTTEIRTTDGQTTTVAANPLQGAVTLVVEPLLALNKSKNAATTWFLLPAPGSVRPGLITGFLSGHETPDLRVKNDQGTRVGGGDIPAEQGSFDDDTIQYRVRHVVGASVGFPEFTFVSNGAA